MIFKNKPKIKTNMVDFFKIVLGYIFKKWSYITSINIQF